MSWDILLFNSKQKIESVEAIDESQLAPTNFTQIIENCFSKILRDDNHREIKGKDFSIGFLNITNHQVTSFIGLFLLIKRLANDFLIIIQIYMK